MDALFAGLEEAFGRFGGVPRELLFDQMRAVVTSDDRSDGGSLAVNAEFQRFAAHWGFRAHACRTCRACTKGKVERPIGYMRGNFFYGREFAGDADLDEQARRWLEGTANVRRHGTTGERPADRFEQDERAAPGPLAARSHVRLAMAGAASRSAPPAKAIVAVAVEVERRSLSVYAEAVR